MIFRHIVVLGTTNESAVLSNANLSNLDPNFLIPGPMKLLRYIVFVAKSCKILYISTPIYGWGIFQSSHYELRLINFGIIWLSSLEKIIIYSRTVSVCLGQVVLQQITD